MTETTKQIPQPKGRLKFIDLARSIAILLMLEGHFIDLTLDDSYRDLALPAYATWLYIRGFTGAMFLSVTGIVFVYLMLNNINTSFWSNIRVKKGFKRVIELIFWGYLLQLYAFHVLQCIAFGILMILLIFGLYRKIKVIPLWIYYFIVGFALFWSYLYIVQLPFLRPWPENAPYFVQNMFYGPLHRAVFPITPWMGFTMFGAAIGAILYQYKEKVKNWTFMLPFIAIGAFLFFTSKPMLLVLDFHYFGKHQLYYQLDWLFERLGMVMMVLGVLMILEKVLKDIPQTLFLKMGQNTLTVYIIHMVVLYGSIIGIGVNKFFNRNLDPYQAIMGAVIFITFHLILIKNIEAIKKKLEFILRPISNFWAKIYRFD
ncbi:MAG: heparan-alpha-glucosaminide N-acetyltransferase domain-containing protein [Bacteroidota bacterium]